MKTMRHNFALAPLSAIIAAGAMATMSPGLRAQDATEATLSGRVTAQEGGRPLKGARVTINSAALLRAREAVTDDNGSYRVRMLPGGEYTVVYSMDGFISRRMTIRLVAGAIGNGSAALRPVGDEGMTVEIAADPIAAVDKTDTVVQTAFSSERMEEIGGMSLNFLRTLTPGIQGSPDDVMNIRGGTGRSTKTLMNGQDVTDMFLGTGKLAATPIEDLVESMAIIQSPLNGRYGNTDGGLMSVVTKRGTNVFHGSLRLSGGRGTVNDTNGRLLRPLWAAQAVNYPTRMGYTPDPTTAPPDDNFSRVWSFTLTGPIWKDYLTFSYGGSINPIIYGTLGSGSSPMGTDYGSNYNYGLAPVARLGTYYEDRDINSPHYGDVVRRANLGAFTSRDALVMRNHYETNNQFTLFGQIAPGHQLEYTYRYSDSRNIENGQDYMIDTSDDYYNSENTSNWSAAYKGVIGSSGVLDVRVGRSSAYRDKGASGGISVMHNFQASLNPINGSNANLANIDNYNRSGIIDSNSVYRYLDDMLSLAAGGTESSRPKTLGRDLRGSNGSWNETWNANYQHVMDWRGTHIIDAGFSMQKAEADMAANNAQYSVNAVGQLAWDLNRADVGNRYNTPDPEIWNWYRGKYIVYNAREAYLSHLDPHLIGQENKMTTAQTGSTYYIPDGLIYDDGRLHPDLYYNYGLPYMNLSWGPDAGVIKTTQTSFWLTDVWTISDNHQVMASLRADSFKLGDYSRDSILSYTKPTPRFEYTYDVNGDQSRVFKASYAQFHSTSNLSLYSPFVDQKFGYRTRMYWDSNRSAFAGAAGAPAGYYSGSFPGYFLVGLSELMNPDNYGIRMPSELSGSAGTAIDPSFKPPTSTEMSVSFRRAYSNGGSWKITLVTRSFADTYDYFAGDVIDFDDVVTGAHQRLLRTDLRNTDEFDRSYKGVEVTWDLPIGKRFNFGGHYTYARLMHNQTAIGTAADSASTADVAGTSLFAGASRFQTLWHWDEMFANPELVELLGRQISRNDWMPMLRQGSEFSFMWYITANLTQGKAKSNFTLRGNYTGASVQRSRIFWRMGYPIFPGVNDNHAGTAGATGVTGEPNHVANVRNLQAEMSMTAGLGTGYDSHSETFRYNLTMPLVKNLSWFMTVDINNPFNHKPKLWGAPGQDVAGGPTNNDGYPAMYYTPLGVNGPRGFPPSLAWDPNHRFHDGTRWQNVGNINGAYSGFGSGRSISMNTGLRF